MEKFQRYSEYLSLYFFYVWSQVHVATWEVVGRMRRSSFFEYYPQALLTGKWLVEWEGLPSLNIARNMCRESDMQIGRNKNFLWEGKICWTVASEIL